MRSLAVSAMTASSSLVVRVCPASLPNLHAVSTAFLVKKKPQKSSVFVPLLRFHECQNLTKFGRFVKPNVNEIGPQKRSSQWPKHQPHRLALVF